MQRLYQKLTVNCCRSNDKIYWQINKCRHSSTNHCRDDIPLVKLVVKILFLNNTECKSQNRSDNHATPTKWRAQSNNPSTTKKVLYLIITNLISYPINDFHLNKKNINKFSYFLPNCKFKWDAFVRLCQILHEFSVLLRNLIWA